MKKPTETAAEFIEIGQSHLQILIARKWPEMHEILKAEGELKVAVSLVITNRTPEAGEHADKDNRVKTTISFSKKFSDSTESALEDSDQMGLPLDGPAPKRFTEIDLLARAEREFPDEQMLTKTFVELRNLKGIDPEDLEDFSRDFDEFLRGIREKIEAKSAPQGGNVEAGQGQTSVGAALDKQAIETTNALLDMKLPSLPLKTAFAFGREFKKAAKKAHWSEAQIKLAFDQLETLATPEEKIVFLSAHIKQPEPPAPISTDLPEVDCVPVPRIPLVLDPGYGADRVRMLFRQGAKAATWKDPQIEAVDYRLHEIQEGIMDEPEAGDACRKHLEQYLCAPEAKNPTPVAPTVNENDLPL